MTGVIKSSRCGTCRRRKVKCDEVKPVCGPCQKKNRICEEPVSKFKFSEELPKLPILSTSGPPSTNDVTPAFNFAEIAVVRSIPTTEGGGSFQTLRLVRGRQHERRDRNNGKNPVMPRGPPMTGIESLQSILCQAFVVYQGGYRVSALARFVTEVPARLGHSEALDSAVACLINCHASLCRGEPAGQDSMQASLYAKCIVSLQRALEDPVEAYKDDTLAAVTILGQVEVYGGGFQGQTGWITHAGGAAKLIQVRGPDRYKSTFSRMLLSMQRGHSIILAISRGEDCYLAESSWQQISFEENYREDTHEILFKFITSLLTMPSICKQIRAFHQAPESIDPAAIFLAISQLRNSLAEVDQFIHTKLNHGIDITKVPTQLSDSPTPFVYDFSSNSLADLCVYYWGFSIIINTMMARFLPYRPLWTGISDASPAATAISPSVTIEALSDDCVRMRQHIFRSYEFSERRWPLDVMYMVPPLIFACHGAMEDEKEWLISKLWKLGELTPNARKSWGKAGIEFILKLYLGEPIPVVSWGA